MHFGKCTPFELFVSKAIPKLEVSRGSFSFLPTTLDKLRLYCYKYGLPPAGTSCIAKAGHMIWAVSSK